MYTSVKSRIKEALKSIMDVGEANACHVWKGYDVSTGFNGWHYVPFGRFPIYIGRSLREALEWIKMVKEEQGYD